MTNVYALERSVLISATLETVFSFFTDNALFAEWWGAGSRIEPHAGGEVYIRYPEGTVARGNIESIDPPNAIIFTYGYEGGANGLAPGASLVSITLNSLPNGTLVRLHHDLPTAALRDAHGPGWRFQLALFANVAARHQHANLADTIDRFFATWTEPDADKRARELAATATPNVVFRDAYANVEGIDELASHIAALQRHMPGVRLTRVGAVRQCQGTALVDWTARSADGRDAGAGTNAVDLSPAGLIARVVGFWGKGS
jgi:uncharacterized protein YndB with AHSA1/START domain